ncbi:archaeosortase/exosortase family protein [Colwellia sp. BRX8-4]|uniref:archaeosortase/exosortase family protein n=1 Tax=Colwellia sp. BRX8-4 TaxID=2759836 RepID=UPI0015F4AF94|nr:archaeosortase/exosortase family protein [Colwellia sp. BRX8-4]MBA6372147.1 archaeosortase/exosortase family protein [Colwellia sp. BRX8-4]
MKPHLIRAYSYPVLTLVFLAAISLIFTNTAGSYIEKWSKFDESLGHGFLIFMVVVFEIIKSSKDYIPKIETKRHFLLIGIIALAFAHEISAFWGILIFQQICFYLLWITTIGYALGLNYLKHISFPLVFFLFAVPFWEFSNTFFVDLTTQAVTFFLGFSDLTVYIHKNFIETPYGIIEVAEGCSGIRYFQIAFALAVYAAHDEPLSYRLKFLIIIVGISLGIITNWIRVLALIYIGYWSEMTSPLMKEHDTYGFLLFFVVISSVIFLLNFLRKHYTLKTKALESVVSTNKIHFILQQSIIKLSLVIICLISSLLLINKHQPTTTQKINNASPQTEKLLSLFGKFTESTKEISFYGEQCLLINRVYDFTSSGSNIFPYNAIYNRKNFKLLNQRYKNININGEDFDVNEIHLRSVFKRNSFSMYYWYEYSNYKIQNKYLAKLFEINYLINSSKKMSLKVIQCN